jgi:HSF-type DNA-binding
MSDDPNNNIAPRGRKKRAAMKNRDSSEEEDDESDAAGGNVARAPVVMQEMRMGQENEDDEADARIGGRSYQYRDRSRDFSSDLKTSEGGEGDSATELPHSTQSFPVKLHRILSNPEYLEIVSWLPHGRAWRILQLKAFEDKVLPLYFRHGRHASFARQASIHLSKFYVSLLSNQP